MAIMFSFGTAHFKSKELLAIHLIREDQLQLKPAATASSN
jgi:hypothetical protein